MFEDLLGKMDLIGKEREDNYVPRYKEKRCLWMKIQTSSKEE